MILDKTDESNKIVFKKIFSFFLGILIIGLLIVLYILQNISGVNEKINLMHLEKEKRILLKEQQELNVNIGFLMSPENLDKLARQQFRMRPMTGKQIYIVKLKN